MVEEGSWVEGEGLEGMEVEGWHLEVIPVACGGGSGEDVVRESVGSVFYEKRVEDCVSVCMK